MEREAATSVAVHLPEASPAVSVSKIVGSAFEITVQMLYAGIGLNLCSAADTISDGFGVHSNPGAGSTRLVL